jgi:hypothetical protein
VLVPEDKVEMLRLVLAVVITDPVLVPATDPVTVVVVVVVRVIETGLDAVVVVAITAL